MTGSPTKTHIAERVRGVSMPMRDGVRLLADVYGDVSGRLPVILERTPYGKGWTDPSERVAAQGSAPSREAIAQHYVDAGFIYVVQDCRGTGESEGVFDKYVQEAEDGADTLAFLLAVGWCDGRIAMVGHSYGASVQVSVAGLGTRQLAAIVADCGGFSDAFTSGIRQGGAFDQKQATWVITQAARDLERAGDHEGAARLRAEPLRDWLLRGPWVAGHTPLSDIAPLRQANLSRFWQSGEASPFWRRPGLFVDHDRGPLHDLPCLHISSWHDTSLRSTIENFTGSTGPGVPGTAMIIGTWCHAARYTSRSGDVDFGDAALPEIGLGAPLIDLRTHWIKDRLARHPLDGSAVRYFEMGGESGTRGTDGAIAYGGRWRNADSWPPRDGIRLDLVVDGGRLLTGAAARSEVARPFVSDPNDPVPTLGGAINSGAPVMQGGMFDQTSVFPFALSSDGSEAVTHRDDMLMIISEPFEQDLCLCGDVSAELYVSSDVPDADICIKLVDCYPDGGPCLNLTDGILRLRYREGYKAPVLLSPGVPVRATIEANPTAALVRAGHRLRLDIAGSNFPHFDINPQTGGPQGVPGARQRGQITIHSGPDYPSRLSLVIRPLES